MELKVGDMVKLPFNEIGTITEIKNIPWGFKYVVKIRNATFNNTGELHDFREQDLELEENISQKI